jgi:integrase
LRAGLDPAQFAGHSLRRGFATTAARNGAPERWIQRQTGHRSVVMLRAYVEEGTLFTENAATYLGL